MRNLQENVNIWQPPDSRQAPSPLHFALSLPFLAKIFRQPPISNIFGKVEPLTFELCSNYERAIGSMEIDDRKWRI